MASGGKGFGVIDIAILCFTLFNSILAILTMLMLAPSVADKIQSNQEKRFHKHMKREDHPQCL